MKTILLATDYSYAANNALRYAIELAIQAKAKLILFHAYTIPLPVSEVQMVMPAVITELKEENTEKIKKLEAKVVKLIRGKIKVESFISSGMPVNEILAAIKNANADLVVLGIKDIGKIAQMLMGSTATFLMRKTSVPVLIIPQRAKFNKSRKIVLAYDYREPIQKDILKKIREFANFFKAEIQVLNVIHIFEEPGYKKASKLVKLQNALKGIRHNFYFPASENITDEINSFVRQQKPEMLVMLPHKHTVLESLLYHSSDTKRMAFQTKIPLLSLND